MTMKWEYTIIRLAAKLEMGVGGSGLAVSLITAEAEKAINSAGLKGWRLSKIVTTTYMGNACDFHAIMEREVEDGKP